MSKAKFKVGDKVNHAPAADGSSPAGTGTVETVDADGKTFSYTVRCDDTGKVLTAKFNEADLSAV